MSNRGVDFGFWKRLSMQWQSLPLQLALRSLVANAGAALDGTWFWEQATAMLCLNGDLNEASEEEIRFDILWSRRQKKDAAG